MSTDREAPLLRDYRLERWLASARYADSARGTCSSHGGDYHWTERVQYAVGHAVNRYYSADPAMRRHADAGELVDYRWPRRIAYFDSEQSYWQLKDQVARNLHAFFASDGYEGQRPVMLYETFETRIEELGIDLSMIVQAAWQGTDEQGLHLQKFVVEYDPAVLDGYRHAARVFCRCAFGADPAKIEAYHVLSGEYIDLSLDDIPYENSLDYLKLAYSGMKQGDEEQLCVCGRCRREKEASTELRLS
ncbi:hypothetical protein CDO73_07405 [Saccharibacillus sp. O23]|uniref:hypothetical protein n=1 Tax=Saccharibacillus sp. O23 TaxID=2009338 RepID=UPI000B4E7612|nr:hypothetical protein [Saccharibacillus sp. O23]OWR31542.1 hypothetical protein CDO73_07405 [Saccharibacillus sp. O23]